MTSLDFCSPRNNKRRFVASEYNSVVRQDCKCYDQSFIQTQSIEVRVRSYITISPACFEIAYIFLFSRGPPIIMSIIRCTCSNHDDITPQLILSCAAFFPPSFPPKQPSTSAKSQAQLGCLSQISSLAKHLH